jgi:hypothetical protein
MTNRDQGRKASAAADDSVTRKSAGDAKSAGKSQTRRGEDVTKQEREAGHRDAGVKGKSARPVGKSTARESTGVDPQEPIDPRGPTPKRGGG